MSASRLGTRGYALATTQGIPLTGVFRVLPSLIEGTRIDFVERAEDISVIDVLDEEEVTLGSGLPQRTSGRGVF